MKAQVSGNGGHRRAFGQSHQPRRQRAAFLPAPLKMVLFIWGLIFLNFVAGPNAFPVPKFTSLLLIGSAIVLFSSGCLVGAAKGFYVPPYAQERADRNFERWRLIATIGSWLSAAGAILSVILNIMAGKTLGMALNNTQVVRQQVIDSLGFTSIVSNAVGFTAFSWLIVSVILCRRAGGVAKNRWSLMGAILGVVAILFLYVINVNRTAFLVLIFFFIQYISVVEHGRIRGAIRHFGKKFLIAAVLVAIICLPYILFIAVARADRGENERFVAEFMELKYRVGWLEKWNYDTACGVYKLQWYASHQIRNFDQVLSGGTVPLFNFDGRLFFAWPITQAAKVYPQWADVATRASDDLAAQISLAGAYAWQWCTALLVFCYDFGIFGALALVFGLGWLVGWGYQGFKSTGSVLSAVLTFWWGVIAMLLFVNYPIDNFIQTNLFGILVIKFYFSLVGKEYV